MATPFTIGMQWDLCPLIWSTRERTQIRRGRMNKSQSQNYIPDPEFIRAPFLTISRDRKPNVETSQCLPNFCTLPKLIEHLPAGFQLWIYRSYKVSTWIERITTSCSIFAQQRGARSKPFLTQAYKRERLVYAVNGNINEENMNKLLPYRMGCRSGVSLWKAFIFIFATPVWLVKRTWASEYII